MPTQAQTTGADGIVRCGSPRSPRCSRACRRTLRRHGARRLVPDRGAGPAGPRGHPVRQRRLVTRARLVAGLPAGAAARSGRAARRCRTTSGCCERVFRRAPTASTSSTSTSTTCTSRCATSPLPAPSRRCTAGSTCRSCGALRRVSRGPAGLDLRRPARAAARAQLAGTVYHGLPRDLFHLPRRAAAAISPSSAASRPRSAWTAPSRSPGAPACRSKSRPRSTPRSATTSSAIIEPLLDASRCVEFIGEIGERDKDEFLGTRRAAVPDRLAGAVRPGDDRGAGVRHAGHRLAPRLGARSHRRRRDRLRRGRARTSGGGRTATRSPRAEASVAAGSSGDSARSGWRRTTSSCMAA